MTPIQSILVTTDFSEAAHDAVRRAALIAAQHGARITLLHVVDTSGVTCQQTWRSSAEVMDQKIALAQVALGCIAAEIAGRFDLHVTPVVSAGDALELICRASAKADLLVIGSQRVNPLRGLILGTPAERLLRVIQRPILVTKRAAQSAYEQVLIPVELAAGSQAMVCSAATLAPTASLHVLHALSNRRRRKLQASDVPGTVIEEYVNGERERGLWRLRSSLASMGLRGVRISVEHGDPSALTLETQREAQADLIVLGQGGPASWCNFLLGEVTQRVLSRASCDVLIIPRSRPPYNANASIDGAWLAPLELRSSREVA